MYVVIALTVPTRYLVDTCAGGTWSEVEADAVCFHSRPEAIEAVLAAELYAGAELGELWDVIAAAPG
jgi:hypothetical protein